MIKDFLEQFLFFPNKDIKKTPAFINLNYEDIFIDNETDKYHGWFIQGNYKNSITKNKCILFFHGNAGNISFRLNYAEKLCIKSGELFYKYLINDKKFAITDVIFYGESIGGAIASSVANIYNVKYLILQSTFTDIKEIIKNIISFNIFMDIIGFETLKNLKIRHKLNKINKKMKTMIIHSNDDELIDNSHADNLATFSDKLYMCSGSHSNLNIDADFIFNLLSFVKEN